MTNIVDSGSRTCQVVDLAEFKAARELRRIGPREAQGPAASEVAQQLPLLEDGPDLGSRALVRQVPHRQRMLAHLESVTAGSATSSV